MENAEQILLENCPECGEQPTVVGNSYVCTHCSTLIAKKTGGVWRTIRRALPFELQYPHKLLLKQISNMLRMDPKVKTLSFYTRDIYNLPGFNRPQYSVLLKRAGDDLQKVTHGYIKRVFDPRSKYHQIIVERSAADIRSTIVHPILDSGISIDDVDGGEI